MSVVGILSQTMQCMYLLYDGIVVFCFPCFATLLARSIMDGLKVVVPVPPKGKVAVGCSSLSSKLKTTRLRSGGGRCMGGA